MAEQPAWMRRQMEQILELDMEELEVEEVDDSASSSSSDVSTFLRNTHGGGETGTSEEVTINTSRASLHTYVGEVVDTRSRFAFLNGGEVLNLPMLYLQGFVLFPEATLTLRVIQPRFLATVDKAINHVDAPCMIGVVHVYRHINDGLHSVASIGTTAEIHQVRQSGDGTSNVSTRGQQRFRLRRSWIDADEVPWGEVQIIEEDTPSRTPRNAFVQLAANTGMCYFSNEDEDLMRELSWQNHDCINEFDASVNKTNMGDDDDLRFAERQRQYRAACNSKMALEAPLSFWPRWAYKMYDSYSLARRAADLWRQIVANPSMDDHVRKPDLLSFCIGSKLPISGSARQELLEIDGISYRLQREIQLLKAFNLMRCRNCLVLIARRSDMVVISNGCPVGAYVKPFDGAQEMITVYNASGLALYGNPSEVHSWFPGYTWTIALCAACESNIGWLFSAAKKNLVPKSFWGQPTRCWPDINPAKKGNYSARAHNGSKQGSRSLIR
ncbi:hypothetical protein BRADI_2g49550v3 [Brachypodium distachyon]|uniref:Protein cereblon n=1 Tax=Brachypodium distachyon TaxID=15368 RepID=A0A2K2DEW4_BRADI|nr:hypothetical protein BRADI_2g49550v3 [Brachypodium distachyon]